MTLCNGDASGMMPKKGRRAMVDMRAYIGKIVDTRNIKKQRYKYYSDGGGGDHKPAMSIFVDHVPGEFFGRTYTLSIHLGKTGRIERIERLRNGYLIKKYPEDIDKKARGIMKDITPADADGELESLVDSAKG